MFPKKVNLSGFDGWLFHEAIKLIMEKAFNRVNEIVYCLVFIIWLRR